MYICKVINNEKTEIMTFTKISNGNYKFKGVDSWNGKEIEGNII